MTATRYTTCCGYAMVAYTGTAITGSGSLCILFPAARDFDSVAQTLLSNARSDGGEC